MFSMIFRILFVVCILFIPSCISAIEMETKFEEDSRLMQERSERIAKLWNLEENIDLKEITMTLLASSEVSEERKQQIRAQGRRFFLFTYPSDGLKVKAVISFVENPEKHRTMLYLRGGNGIFGIPSPASDFSSADNLTVLIPAYRGGVSEGKDEFGGRDVHDVKALIDFLPELEQKLSLQIQKDQMFLLGASRGSMQMFLVLARYPELQPRFSKIASLTGLVDMNLTLKNRTFKEMFIEEFGLNEGVNEVAWIAERDPIQAVEKISKDLPILIIQSRADLRVELQGGHHMLQKLQKLGHSAIYWEFEKDEHNLYNRTDRIELLLSWFM